MNWLIVASGILSLISSVAVYVAIDESKVEAAKLKDVIENSRNRIINLEMESADRKWKCWKQVNDSPPEQEPCQKAKVSRQSVADAIARQDGSQALWLLGEILNDGIASPK